MSVDEHTIELGSTPVFYRTATAPAAGPTPLYLHDIPTSSDDWIPFLERTGGIAPDLIGFGRSGKGVALDYSVAGLADFVEDLLAALGTTSRQLVGHGWGAAVALELLRRGRRPIERLVVLNPLPLVDNFRWPAIARVWRVRIVGELAMGFTTRWMLARRLRRGAVNPAAWPEERVRAVWEQFDQGTQRATLRLHRSIDGTRAEGPADPASARALLIWGEEDPWFPVALADPYRELLPSAQLERIAEAGHWPWLDQPHVIDRVAAFLER